MNYFEESEKTFPKNIKDFMKKKGKLEKLTLI